MARVRAPSPQEYGACLDVIREARHEAGRDDEPFDALVWARTDGPDDERALAYPEVGATWWVEAFDPRRDTLTDVRHRIDAGPPRTR